MLDWYLSPDYTTAPPAPDVTAGLADYNNEQDQMAEPEWTTLAVVSGIETTSTTTEPPQFEALSTSFLAAAADQQAQPNNINTGVLVDKVVGVLNSTLTPNETSTLAKEPFDTKAYVSRLRFFISFYNFGNIFLTRVFVTKIVSLVILASILNSLTVVSLSIQG